MNYIIANTKGKHLNFFAGFQPHATFCLFSYQAVIYADRLDAGIASAEIVSRKHARAGDLHIIDAGEIDPNTSMSSKFFKEMVLPKIEKAPAEAAESYSLQVLKDDLKRLIEHADSLDGELEGMRQRLKEKEQAHDDCAKAIKDIQATIKRLSTPDAAGDAFKPGEVVRLKSGGPDMTVDEITDKDNVKTIYSRDGKTLVGVYNPETLERIPQFPAGMIDNRQR